MTWTRIKKQPVLWLALVILLLALSLAGYRYKKQKEKNGAPEFSVVTKGNMETRFRETGEVIPKIAVDIQAKVSGRIVDRYIQEGSVVKKGDKLVLLQPGRSELDKYVPIEITAPLGGVVLAPASSQRLAQPGDFVLGLLDTSNPTVLMTVADVREMMVELKISEMDILKLKTGMNVEVSVDAVANEIFSGQVQSISPSAAKDNNNLKKFKVLVRLTKNDQRLRTGMTARVEAVLAKKTGILTIPLNVIYEEKGQEYVYLAQGKKAERQSVKTGLKNELNAEVLDGLKEGDQIYPEKPADAAK